MIVNLLIRATRVIIIIYPLIIRLETNKWLYHQKFYLLEWFEWKCPYYWIKIPFDKTLIIYVRFAWYHYKTLQHYSHIADNIHVIAMKLKHVCLFNFAGCRMVHSPNTWHIADLYFTSRIQDYTFATTVRNKENRHCLNFVEHVFISKIVFYTFVLLLLETYFWIT